MSQAATPTARFLDHDWTRDVASPLDESASRVQDVCARCFAKKRQSERTLDGGIRPTTYRTLERPGEDLTECPPCLRLEDLRIQPGKVSGALPAWARDAMSPDRYARLLVWRWRQLAPVGTDVRFYPTWGRWDTFKLGTIRREPFQALSGTPVVFLTGIAGFVSLWHCEPAALSEHLIVTPPAAPGARRLGAEVYFAQALRRAQKRKRLPPPFKVCLGCGCTERDCRKCIELTGAPCWWVSPHLCSACRHVRGIRDAQEAQLIAAASDDAGCAVLPGGTP